MAANAWRSLMRGILVFTNVLFLLLGLVLISLGGTTPWRLHLALHG
jgi:hypothetical protein